MPLAIRRRKKRRQIIFMSKKQIPSHALTPSERLEALISTTGNSKKNSKVRDRTDRFEKADQEEPLSEDDSLFFCSSKSNMATDGPQVPSLFTSLPPIRDTLGTETSKLQDSTARECLPFMRGVAERKKSPWDLNEHGVPSLERQKHVAFLHSSLGGLPAGFVGIDSSRPWMLYWALTGLSLLGEDVSQYRERVIYTLSPMQNPDGGFGGGHGQMSHCASSYASILSLAMVGGEEALSLVDRKMLWRWLGSLKQRDGGFQVCVGGEEDVRGAFCSMVMISLLNLPLDLPLDSAARVNRDDTFLTGLPEYLSRCQTFEGGISGAPGTEAHGAYAFCALACLCILGEPHKMLARYLNLPLLISWLSARQYAPESGFAGRTNKLVDGCYSHWVGGCWPLVEAALNGPQSVIGRPPPNVGSLYSREGLIRYILCCCQGNKGGLRDKPSKHPDSYHSCYVLAGLSSAQHYYYFQEHDASQLAAPLSSAFHWASSQIIPASDGEEQPSVFDTEDRVNLIHPIYVIPWGVAERTRAWYEAKAKF
ncbi:MAG: CAAX farnesyltransferase (FTase) subunit beta [Candelina mexicana]|nr:MAG: CAAX farnesyltransferase (FTase) subunit beta [Candelina mexicana]